MRLFLLAAYRYGWRLLLPPVRLLAGLDGLLRVSLGRGILPRNWRVTERFAEGGSGTEAAPALWLHCASLGEAKGMWAFALSLVEAESLVLTATTATGTDFLEKQCRSFATREGPYPRRMRACMAPLDHPAVVSRFLERYRVRGLCLYEMELWPHYLSACSARGLKIVLVSARITAKAAARYRRFGSIGARLLDELAWIQTQTESDGERFRALTKVDVLTGFDFKAAHYLDAALTETGAHPRFRSSSPSFPPPLPIAQRFAFVSLHLSELHLLLPGLVLLGQRFGLMVFPRHMSQVRAFRRLLEPLGFADHSRDPNARHLLVDSLGLVGPLLRQCHSAFVGGSFVRAGCHNLWEPVAAGAKIYLGPNLENQEAWAGLLRDRGIAEVLGDPIRIGTCGLPGPEIRIACAALLEDFQGRLDSALADGGRMIFVTFYPNVKAGTVAGV